MIDARNFDPQLLDLRERSIDRLLKADFLDLAAFERLLDYLENKADQIAADYVVSKQALASLRDAQSAILSRSEYLDQVKEHARMADRFAFLLDLIILGERPRDRAPGVPRIV